MPAAMKRPLGWPLVSVLALWGCSDARLGDSFSQGQTKIRVSPVAFIGDVPCVRGAVDGLTQYVVQLREVGADDAGVEPTTSPPVPCDRSVTFPAVPLRLYRADILGYDRAIEPDDVGSVEPRWTASCGHGDPNFPADAGVDPFAPTLAVRGATVALRGCAAFGGATSSSQLVVDVSSALGDLRCGSEPGEVGLIEAVLEGSRQVVACGEPLVFAIATPGGVHTVDLAGYELAADAGFPEVPEAGPLSPAPDSGSIDAGPSDAAPADASADSGPTPSPADAALDAADAGQPAPSTAPTWRTRCEGRSLAGVSRTATCEPFTRIVP